MKSCFSEKNNKINTSLVQTIRKTKKTQINKIRDEKEMQKRTSQTHKESSGIIKNYYLPTNSKCRTNVQISKQIQST